MSTPTLVIVAGPAGSGKTTLAHELARAIGCPSICRDEIKEGIAFGEPDFTPDVGDELTQRILPVFFDTIRFLVESGVTTIAEAAFQHHVWAPNVVHLAAAAELRIVRCRTDATTARERVRQRASLRTVHADTSVLDDPDYYSAYRWLELDAPSIDVDTTNGYRPTIAAIAHWIAQPAS
jgi:predicted kinase